MDIYLVTKNKGKLMAAQAAFAGTSSNLLSVNTDYPEIQAETSTEIARHTAREAARDHNAPTIREDHSLYINALGIPGPYMSFFEKKISPALLLKLLTPFTDRTGFFEVATAYAEPNGTTQDFLFRVPIVFATEERGTLQEGWNRIIMLEGETRTLAEYPENERLAIWSKNYVAIAKSLNQEKVS